MKSGAAAGKLVGRMHKDPAPSQDPERGESRPPLRERFGRWLRGDGRRAPGSDRTAQQLNQVSAAMTFGVTVVVFALGGVGLDSWLGTSPLCLLLLGALGMFGGFVHLVESISPGTLFPSRKAPKTPDERGRKDERDERRPGPGAAGE